MKVSVVVEATTSQHKWESGRNCRILQMPFPGESASKGNLRYDGAGFAQLPFVGFTPERNSNEMPRNWP